MIFNAFHSASFQGIMDSLSLFGSLFFNRSKLLNIGGVADDPIFTVLLFIFGFLLIVLIIGSSKIISFGTSTSYTTLGAKSLKLRLLSLLSLVLIPVVAYYESEALKLYEANWPLVAVIAVFSFLGVLLSFYPKITARPISVYLSLLVSIDVSIIYLIAFQREMNSTLVVEASMLLLFSKVIFQKNKDLLFFFLYIYLFLGILIFYYDPDIEDLSVLFSTVVLGTLVTISMKIAQGGSVNNLSFASKILENSDLLVVVFDFEGNVVYLSKPLITITKKSEKQLLGMGWWKFRDGASLDLSELKSNIENVAEGNKQISYIKSLDIGKARMEVEWTDYLLEDTFIMSIGKDVTDELEDQKEIEMLSLVATSVSNGVLILDADDKVIWTNGRLSTLTGFSEERILGKDVIGLLRVKCSKDDRLLEKTNDIIENSNVNVNFYDSEGINRHFLLSNSIIPPEGRMEKRRILVWTDYTDEWKLEKRYKDIINNAFDNIYTTDYKGRFTFVNKKMEEYLGISSEELLKLDYTHVMHPIDREATIKFYKNQFKNKQEYSYKEFRITNSKKEVRWLGQNVRLILNDKKTKVEELHAVARDITEDKKNKRQLKRLSHVAKRTENIVIILNDKMQVEWVNDAFENTFGYTSSEVIGKIPGNFLNGKNTDPDIINKIKNRLKNYKHVDAELINYDKEGNEKWIQISMDPILNEKNKLINYIAVETDITDRKSKELTIKKQHDAIISSITYSSIIQNATLPDSIALNRTNENMFVFYRPKDIIGGDFYHVQTIENNKGNKLQVYIVADCTGHGVPGAMLSVLFTSVLKEAIKSSEVHNPADMLSYTRTRILELFKSNKNETIYDGMDLSVCVVDRSTGFLDYSGANRPLLIIQNREVVEIKGNKQSVGFNHSLKEYTFTRHSFERGDQLYMFSDGLIDQFGGPRNRKFMSKRFKELILEIQDQPMKVKKQSLSDVFDQWKGSEEQTDDVCVMGVEI